MKNLHWVNNFFFLNVKPCMCPTELHKIIFGLRTIFYLNSAVIQPSAENIRTSNLWGVISNLKKLSSFLTAMLSRSNLLHTYQQFPQNSPSSFSNTSFLFLLVNLEYSSFQITTRCYFFSKMQRNFSRGCGHWLKVYWPIRAHRIFCADHST